ncbi:hypothetical protein GQX73_g3049 [Xylaria multiplex]|uniref:CENP-V/GFA domain-containing protein n=1 Tax=Xylaria multiplex TaxID=323545 RepID=A0A7C8MU74_9PEZI|nr:hypothetical protein GQX73_g3049 [Xylaria multiplex]
MAPVAKLLVSCHCGAAKQTVRLCDQVSSTPQEISLCHCSACRHNTGLLCVSYASIERPDSTEGLVEYYSKAKTTTRFFCAICGCHIFWRLQSSVKDETGVADDAVAVAERWAVATGVITGESGEWDKEGSDVLMRWVRHINTASTKDGGLSPFIRRVGGTRELEVVDNQSNSPLALGAAGGKLEGSDHDVELETISRGDSQEQSGDEILNAFCHCKTVQFHITRPNLASKLPRSNFPDLMVPYHAGSPHIQNPEDNKWWLRPGLTSGFDEPGTLSIEKNGLRRYLAGTCACRSCRLVSGFEIQTWAFIPRANIFFHIRDTRMGPSNSESRVADGGTNIVPLDFATLPANILTSYESSQGVRREFCSRCGATVFWRDRWRPELMDVSVGLLDADEGARAESWLDWWTGRVSFAEDADNDRTGDIARSAKCLIDGLEDGLGRWGEEGEKARRNGDS